MKLYLSLAVLLFTIFTLSSPAYSGETRYVRIKKPFVSVYEKLDPKSNIIKQVSKGDHLELVYEGTSWYQVKVDGKNRPVNAWIEKNSGIIVDNPGKTILSIPVGTFVFFILLLIATIGVAVSIIYRQKTPEIL